MPLGRPGVVGDAPLDGGDNVALGGGPPLGAKLAAQLAPEVRTPLLPSDRVKLGEHGPGRPHALTGSWSRAGAAGLAGGAPLSDARSKA